MCDLNIAMYVNLITVVCCVTPCKGYVLSQRLLCFGLCYELFIWNVCIVAKYLNGYS